MRGMAGPGETFELQLERLHLRAMRAACVAQLSLPIPEWLPGRLGEVSDRLAQTPSTEMVCLAEQASLSPVAVDFLWSVVAATVEPRAQAHLIAAFGSDARRGLSTGAHSVLAELEPAPAAALVDVLDPRHPLLMHGLLAPADPRLTASTPFTAARRTVDYLRGLDHIDPIVAAFGCRLLPPSDPALDTVQRATLAALERAVGSATAALVVEGPMGSGRRTAAAIATQRNGRPAIAIDATRVPDSADSAQEALEALGRECVLSGAVPIIANVDAWTDEHRRRPDLIRRLISFIRARAGVTVLTAREGGINVPLDLPVVRFRWGLADLETRRRQWAAAIGDCDDELANQLRALAHRYRLGPGGIERAVTAARLLAPSDSSPIDLPDVVEGVRSNTAERLGKLARHIEVVEGWDDLILPDDSREVIHRLIERLRWSHQVYEEWGFKRRASRGIGVPALFSGPPGTGKTMVAGIIARELDLELYQVDLSQIVSKWVGETEKNLEQVFEAAEAGHALLLFDEADALFAKRSVDVKSAQDRYANLEVNYLLQRIEAFSGIAILTTNLDTSIDQALKRRLAAHVTFYPPDEEERAELWRRMVLTPEAPVDREGFDPDELSRRFPDMSGAHIRNAVLAAAFMAAAGAQKIDQPLLERAARTEYHSMGHVLSGL